MVETAYTLDQQTAYIHGNPIRTPHDMPKKLATNPITEEHEDRLRDRWWYHGNSVGAYIRLCKLEQREVDVDLRMFELRTKLLELGGSEACLPISDDDIDAILGRGQLWHGDRITMKRGLASQCHRNSADYWWRNKEKAVLCTGYALSEDGLWRQHSWLIELHPRRNRIIETTTPRVAYFGFAMTEEEAVNFLFGNV